MNTSTTTLPNQVRPVGDKFVVGQLVEAKDPFYPYAWRPAYLDSFAPKSYSPHAWYVRWADIPEPRDETKSTGGWNSLIRPLVITP